MAQQMELGTRLGAAHAFPAARSSLRGAFISAPQFDVQQLSLAGCSCMPQRKEHNLPLHSMPATHPCQTAWPGRHRSAGPGAPAHKNSNTQPELV